MAITNGERRQKKFLNSNNHPRYANLLFLFLSLRSLGSQRHPVYRYGHFGDHVLPADHRQFHLQGNFRPPSSASPFYRPMTSRAIPFVSRTTHNNTKEGCQEKMGQTDRAPKLSLVVLLEKLQDFLCFRPYRSAKGKVFVARDPMSSSSSSSQFNLYLISCFYQIHLNESLTSVDFPFY